ncbi:hypothetical protein BGX28_008839 [Mortierella sp. GBA30]|nr:hypothetical protein BGX28_008839 [Mortierella sp. GBA30]
MKFSTVAILAAILVVAAAQDEKAKPTPSDGVISIDPITSGTPATETATETAPATETATASPSPSVPVTSAIVAPSPTGNTTVPSITASSAVPSPTSTKAPSSGNGLNAPVKVMAVIGGGAAFLAHLL